MNPSPVTVRDGSPDDASALVRLGDELGYAATEGDVRDRAERLASDPDHVFRVAVRDGVVVGWIHAARIDSLTGAPRLEIRGLVVAHGDRRGGVGARLVADVETWARSRGLTAVRVRSRTERDGARAFYERLGYRVGKTQHVFDRRLDD